MSDPKPDQGMHFRPISNPPGPFHHPYPGHVSPSQVPLARRAKPARRLGVLALLRRIFRPGRHAR